MHRGASAIEAGLWRGVKRFYLGRLNAKTSRELSSALSQIAQDWELKPAAQNRLQHLIKGGLNPGSNKAVRRKTALFLIELISQRVDDGVGYGTISATPNRATAEGWAHGSQEGRIWGRKQQASEVISFRLDLKRASAKVRAGLYAGVEDGSFLDLPASLEVAFVTPEAKLFALEHLELIKR